MHRVSVDVAWLTAYLIGTCFARPGDGLAASVLQDAARRNPSIIDLVRAGVVSITTLDDPTRNAVLGLLDEASQQCMLDRAV